jgi:hypothetical protein
MKRRLAAQATDLLVALPVLKRCEDLTREGGTRYSPFIVDGEMYADAMLESAHGAKVDPRRLPSSTALGGWQRAANLLIALCDRRDPVWTSAYINEQSPTHQRLLRSCITLGNAGIRSLA